MLIVDPPVLGDKSLLPAAASPAQNAARATWAFVLEPLATGATRLHVRVRADFPRNLAYSLMRPMIIALHEIMERKQLETLEHHVERSEKS